MKKIVFIFIYFQVSLNLFSQKEVFFSSTPKDSIEVESLHGFTIGTGIDFQSLIRNSNSDYKSYSFPLNIGYFNEKRITPSCTLITSVALFNNIYLSRSSLANGDSIDHNLYYRLGLGVSITPNWYFGYKRRYQEGKAALNSGWYLSLPIIASKMLINTYKLETPSDFISYASLGGALTLGYRQALSKQWFLEGDASLLGLSTNFYSLNKRFIISSPYFSYLSGISLKAAYIFK